MARKQLLIRLIARFLSILLTVWGAVTLVFVLVHLLPGDPASAAFAQSTANQEAIEIRREQLGLNDPIHVQYVSYMAGLLVGDLGTSWTVGLTVRDLLVSQFVYTLRLTLAALVVAFCFGMLIGLAPSITSGRFAPLWRLTGSVSLSTPVMFSGLILLWLFSVQLDVFPGVGQGTLAHIVLPSLVVGWSVAGALSATVDTNIAVAKRSLYSRTLRMKGGTSTRLYLRHLLPAILPSVLNMLALQTGFLLSGAVITEALFNRSGLGSLMLNAVLSQDWPVLWGGVLLSAAVYAVLLFLTDVSLMIVNPHAARI